MKRLLAAAALAAALSCSAAGTQDIQETAKNTSASSASCPTARAFSPAAAPSSRRAACASAHPCCSRDAVKAPAEERVVRLADPKEDGWHTLSVTAGQKKTVMKMTGREVTE